MLRKVTNCDLQDLHFTIQEYKYMYTVVVVSWVVILTRVHLVCSHYLYLLKASQSSIK